MIHQSLTVRGFNLKPWSLKSAAFARFNSQIPKGENWREFDRKDFHGLFHFTPGALQLVCVMNDKPGSKRFGELVAEMESAADECSLEIEVVHFWNDRLFHWFRRRGYACAKDKARGAFARREPKK